MGTGGSKCAQLKAFEKRFNAEEVFTLRQTFGELAARNHGKFIDREMFQILFRLPGILYDRLFKAFDVNRSGMIEYESFITGLALFVRGTLEERIDFLFRIYDIGENGRITQEGLTTVLNSVLFAGYLIILSQTDPERISDTISDVISNRTKKLVDDAFRFQERDVLTRDQFRRWAIDNSVEVEFALDVFIRDRDALGRCSNRASSFKGDQLTFDGILKSPRSSSPYRGLLVSDASFQLSRYDSFQESMEAGGPGQRPRLAMSEYAGKPGVHITCLVCDYDLSALYCAYCASPLKIRGIMLSCAYCADDKGVVECRFCMNCGSDLRLSLSRDVVPEPIFGEVLVDDLCHPTQGFLWKMCRRLKIVTWKRPWCKLSGNFLYSYPSETAKKPTRMICLEDAQIEFVDHSTLQNRMRFGFRIFSPINQLNRVFYAESESDRERWCRSLRKATRQFCFEDFYTINGKIGQGKFANVYACIRKRNNQKCAVKIINKYDVKQCDRDGLRTEIAVLQFVHHPHVVHLKNVFETRVRIYIVMTLVEGGDLFQHLKEHGCCAEEDARNIMIQILHALLYLHERGIVHRDLKPENIMLVSKAVPISIQVVDFGLSKFIAPEEIMNQACGTQSYLAPEVLRREGYGREVDIWSAGVILYVMLSCHFPFPVKSMKLYLEKALKSEYSLGRGWEHVSEGAKSLIRDMLNPIPRQRITIRRALQHPWILGAEAT